MLLSYILFEPVEFIRHQMWRSPRTGTAALCLGLVLSQLAGEGSVLRVLGVPGQPVTLPCPYHYEDQADVSQLSVQWRSPLNQLLCHFIKHKAYQNCTEGYAIAYRPGSITLTIRHVATHDFGAHVCSVSKRHEFTDSSVELVRRTESVTAAPNSGATRPGAKWTLILLHTLLLFCM